jgi:tRNA A37 methylthiotransferase MiaB
MMIYVFTGPRFVDLLDEVSRIHPDLRVRFTSPHPKGTVTAGHCFLMLDNVIELFMSTL